MENIASTRRRGLQSITPLFVNLFERLMPDLWRSDAQRRKGRPEA
jgi:hypothetical protein